jgi:hypothetical protein
MAQNSTYLDVATYGKQELVIFGDWVDLARPSGPPMDLSIPRAPLKVAASIRTAVRGRVVLGKSHIALPVNDLAAAPQ